MFVGMLYMLCVSVLLLVVRAYYLGSIDEFYPTWPEHVVVLDNVLTVIQTGPLFFCFNFAIR